GRCAPAGWCRSSAAASASSRTATVSGRTANGTTAGAGGAPFSSPTGSTSHPKSCSPPNCTSAPSPASATISPNPASTGARSRREKGSHMQRRDFLKARALAALGLSTSSFPTYAAQAAQAAADIGAKKRVGLIGTGWYGQGDLFRFIQGGAVALVSL